MKKFTRSLNRAFKYGVVRSARLSYVFIPLSLFFAIVITFSGMLMLGKSFSEQVIASLSNKVNIVVYFDRNTPIALQEEILQKINGRADIKKVDIVSADKALADFKERHKNDEVTIKSLEEIGVNPFATSLVIYAKDARGYEVIANDIKTLNETYKNGNLLPIEEVNYDKNRIAIKNFSNMMNRGEMIASLLLVVLFSMLVVTLYLAIRFATQTDREEIKIMKLVGASNLLTIGPTAFMGGLSGLLGGFLSLFMIFFISRYLNSYTVYFDGFNIVNFYMNNIKFYAGFCLGAGFLFGFIASYLAARRHI